MALARFKWYPSAPVQIATASTPAVATVAQFCLDRTKNSHQRGNGLVTGRLRNSYTSRPKGPGLYEVGTDLYYAQYVEFGTRFMRGQHHLAKAAAETAAKFPGTRYG